MATIGNIKNIRKVGLNVQALASICKVIAPEFEDVANDEITYGLDAQQVGDAVSELDAIDIKTAYDILFANFIRTDEIPD